MSELSGRTWPGRREWRRSAQAGLPPLGGQGPEVEVHQDGIRLEEEELRKAIDFPHTW